MTKAQVDLILHDRPVVDYHSSKRKKDGDSKPKHAALLEASERGRENYEKRKGGKVGKLDLTAFENK